MARLVEETSPVHAATAEIRNEIKLLARTIAAWRLAKGAPLAVASDADRPSSPRRMPIETWPGFVDALATLLMVLIFVLMILFFTLFQFYLKDLISGREQALARLSQQIGEIADMLALSGARPRSCG